jgi:predicted O-linked N-acetylglucosamine transferase (SPINDLY family)
VQYHQAGQLPAAERLYRQILEVDPRQPDAWHLLGVIAAQAGQPALARDYIGRAIAIQPDDPTFHSNLGSVYQSQGLPAEAEGSYRRAIALRADAVDAVARLTALLRDQGRRDEAVAVCRAALQAGPQNGELWLILAEPLYRDRKIEDAAECYRQAARLLPQRADVHTALGNLLLQIPDQLGTAANCFRRAVELAPESAEAHFHLGNAARLAGDLDTAAACYRRALALKPDFYQAECNLAVALQAGEKYDEAVACYRGLLARMPDFAEGYCNLGNVLKCQGCLEEAAAAYEKALQLNPAFAAVCNNLGNIYEQQGKLEEAADRFRRAVAMQPNLSGAQGNLGNVLKTQGRMPEAVAVYRQAILQGDCGVTVYSDYLLANQYLSDATSAGLAALSADWDRRYALPLRRAWRTPANDPDPQRPLRLGLVSSDFGRHPVGWFLIRTLESLDRAAFPTVAYSDRITRDDLTARFIAATSEWREIRTLADEMLADQVRADRIDILFDLAGHTAGNRLLLFARKPAPLQIAWIGYPGTTGLAAMDYILADRHQIPAEAEADYSERVLRMPHGYVCYEPPADAPEVAPLPAAEQGFVTFGSFSNPAKITPRVAALWAEILGRVPGSRLMLRYSGLDHPGTRQRYAELFAAYGIAADRLDMAQLPLGEVLAEYGRVDLALDPFPYGGGLTTCEAMWMGVPVVTCPGKTFASRHSTSHLSNVGLTELIAADFSQYVELAVAWATDLPRLAACRAGLRPRMACSPLCDGPRFAADLAEVLRGAWQTWCRQQKNGE